MENEANIANAREAAVQASLKQLEARLGTANSDQVKLRALEREADAQRGLLQDFLARYQETRAQMDISAERQNARVISRPDIPNEPSFPPTMLIAAAALVGSMLLFTVIVLGIEDMDAGLRSGEQVEQLIGERSLGSVTRTGRRQAPQVWLRKNSTSEFAESIRSLYTQLMLIDRRNTFKTLLVTSSLPGEGKSSLVSCLAMYRAMAGQKVLMVDADMRRPSLHLIANASREPGLADGLKWAACVAEMVRPLDQPNLYLLPAGRPVSDATDVLRSTSLARVFEEIEADYDLVIIDSPPLVGFSDAVLIAPFVDMHLLAVRWGKNSLRGREARRQANARGRLRHLRHRPHYGQSTEARTVRLRRFGALQLVHPALLHHIKCAPALHKAEEDRRPGAEAEDEQEFTSRYSYCQFNTRCMLFSRAEFHRQMVV